MTKEKRDNLRLERDYDINEICAYNDVLSLIRSMFRGVW